MNYRRDQVGDILSEIDWNVNGFGRAGTPQNWPRRALRKFIHFFSYHLFLNAGRTRTTRVAGFALTVPPTVFHPRIFITSQFFARYLGTLNLTGQRVAEVGTGSGILALAAARAGAASVIAIDINPNAAGASNANARANGLGHRVSAVCCNLLSAIASRPLFDVIISSPPSFPGKPRDLADRAWHAGPEYRDIASLFEDARQRLAPGGRLYVLLSSDSDLDCLGRLAHATGFRSRLVNERSIIGIESLLIYELALAKAREGAGRRLDATEAVAASPAGGV
jgi:methylase of polypeptide subunit release factors